MNGIVGTCLLGLATLLSLGTTVAAFTQPKPFATSLGLSIANAGGVNEIRSQYAGFFLMVGVVCVGALIGVVPRPAGYLVTLVVFGGLFIGRLVSVTLNQGFSGYPPVVKGLVLIDFVGAALSIAALAERSA